MDSKNSQQSLSNIDPSEKNEGALDLSTELRTLGNQVGQDQNENAMKIENQEEELWHIVKNLEASGPVGTQREDDVLGALNTPSFPSMGEIFTDEFTLSPSNEIALVKNQGTMTNS